MRKQEIELDSVNYSHYCEERYLEQDINQLKQTIIDAISTEVENRGLSQAQLGELCGLERIAVNKILRGTERSVSFQKLIAMANVLDLKVDLKVSKKRSGP